MISYINNKVCKKIYYYGVILLSINFYNKNGKNFGSIIYDINYTIAIDNVGLIISISIIISLLISNV